MITNEQLADEIERAPVVWTNDDEGNEVSSIVVTRETRDRIVRALRAAPAQGCPDDILIALGTATTQTQIDPDRRHEAVIKVQDFLKSLGRAHAERRTAERPDLIKALADARDEFEAIRLILINHLAEPERQAFWKAVEARDAAAAALAGQSPAENVHVTWDDADYARARDCMAEILRDRGWSIGERTGGIKQFDEAFQHAAGILALAARHSQPETGADTSWEDRGKSITRIVIRKPTEEPRG